MLELMVWLDPKLFKAIKETGYNINSSFQKVKQYLIYRFGKKKDYYVTQQEFTKC